MGLGGAGLVRAGQLMLLVSALFEPVRLAVQPFVGDEVGGVGGWGGLTNIGLPEDCDTPNGHGEGWCFKPGVVAGFSAFGLAFLLMWVLPMLLIPAARAAGFKVAVRSTLEPCAEGHDIDVAGSLAQAQAGDVEQAAADASKLSKLLRVWSALTCLWFLLPLVCFVTDPFYRTGFWKAVLGLSLVAAYPLSWHLALVALPVSQLVAPHLALSDPAVKNFHKALGWRTAGWAAMHGGLELIYLASKGLPEQLDVVSHPENWMYLLGLVSLGLMAVHSLLALIRKQQWLRTHFRIIHGLTAVVLLACATAHWPPFALLMLPAAAAHGGGASLRVAKAHGLQPAEKGEWLAMTFAFAGGLLGLSGVWVARERALSQPAPDERMQHMFSVLALAAEGLGGLVGAALALAFPPRCGAAPSRDQLLAGS